MFLYHSLSRTTIVPISSELRNGAGPHRALSDLLLDRCSPFQSAITLLMVMSFEMILHTKLASGCFNSFRRRRTSEEETQNKPIKAARGYLMPIIAHPDPIPSWTNNALRRLQREFCRQFNGSRALKGTTTSDAQNHLRTWHRKRLHRQSLLEGNN